MPWCMPFADDIVLVDETFFFLMTKNPLKVWASRSSLEGQTPDAYTSPLSRHHVNREMPQLGVEAETSWFTVSLGTLHYR